jgi:Domain of unknown function (DUF4413)
VADDGFTRKMSMAMYVKFEKYLGEVNVSMAMTSILDPWLKMISIKFIYERLYSSDEVEGRIKKVMDKLRALYDMYAKNYFSSSGIAGNTLSLLNLHSLYFN